jgi:hypothetical protein
MSGVLKAPGLLGHAAQMIQKAPDFSSVTNHLELLYGKQLRSTVNQDRLTVDAYRAFVGAADKSKEVKDAIWAEGLVYKAKHALGRQLLDDHHTSARSELEDALADVGTDGLRQRLDDFSPAEVSRKTQLLIKREGLSELSKAFAEHMVATGQWPSVNVLYHATDTDRKKMNSDFNVYLRERAAPEASAIMPEVEALGRTVIEHALKTAGISPREAAQTMARSVQTHKGGRASAGKSALKGGGLDKAINRAIRFCGRALPRDARIDFANHREITGRGRSNGRAYQSSVSTGEIDRTRHAAICVTSNMQERTVFHELGHAIDTLNPLANAMVAAWVQKRIENKPTQSLRELTGIKGFKRDEVAVKDDFIDPYVGKVYKPHRGIHVNEALSMGLERLSDPAAAGMLALKDPDHLALVLAALKMEYQP